MTVVDVVSVVGMSRQDFIQLNFYIDEMAKSEVYYGRRDYFVKRHHKLKVWVEQILTSTAGDKIREA